jgi:elongation factor Ts
MITTTQIKELRERTGAGMMECKKALEAAAGNIDAAIEAMRKSGQAKAAKKAGRVAAEGIVVVKTSNDSKKAIMIEVNSETDFVARDTSFLAFAQKVASCALQHHAKDLESLLSSNYEDAKTVAQAREELVGKLGENISVRRLATLESPGIVGWYVHSNNRIGALVALSTANAELGKDIAMHIAASRPLALNDKELSPELLAKEKEILLAQVQDSGKPPAILEKMVEGRLQKFISESTLIKQPFVKNPEVTIEALLKQASANALAFVRYEVGEGIEKKENNFAADVMAQING